VPRSVDSGYVVRCDTNAAGARLPSGSFSVCQDYPRCASCNAVTRFGDDDCVAGAGSGVAQSQADFGAASAQFQVRRACTHERTRARLCARAEHKRRTTLRRRAARRA
jgi:uncharacterized membrane protein